MDKFVYFENIQTD